MRLIGSILVSFLATAAFSAEVYRWTDEQGNVAYSDRPLSSRAEVVSIIMARPSSTPSAPPPATTQAAAPAQQPAAEQAQQPAPQRTPEEEAEIRARNCEIARERVQRYAATNRLYRQLPNGGREYLTDAEIDEARAQAAANVELWCD